MNPFKLLPLTITNTEVYVRLVRQPLSQAWRYFLIWFTLIGTILALNLVIFALPPILNTLTQAVQAVQANLPPDITLNFTDNQLSLTPDKPVSINLPTPFGSLYQALVIDPNLTLNANDALTALVVLSHNSLAYTLDDTGNFTQIIPYQDILTSPASTTTGSFIPYLDSFAATLNFVSNYRFPLTILIVVVGLILLRLFQILISCLFVYVGINLFARRFTFKTIFTLSLYTAVLAEIIWQVSLLLYPVSISFLYPLAFIGTLTIALLAIQRANPDPIKSK